MATGDNTASDPFSQNVTKRGEKGSLTFNEDSKILARPQQPGSNINKEHDRNPGRDAQELRPSTGSCAEIFRVFYCA
jgi:hypothetical protein